MQQPLSVDGDGLRTAMRFVPATVTVVTVGGREPRGVTIASFTSVSLDPPLVSFNVQRSARFHGLLSGARRFAVHVLASDQAGLSDRFADPGLDRDAQFAGVPHRVEPDGLPLLDGVLATFVCEPWAEYDAGDHSLFVGRVVEVSAVDAGEPVLYFLRSYRTVGGELARRADD